MIKSGFNQIPDDINKTEWRYTIEEAAEKIARMTADEINKKQYSLGYRSHVGDYSINVKVDITQPNWRKQ